MRDDKMRSKGYGFANFKTTAQGTYLICRSHREE
jgi:hypothetical protein